MRILILSLFIISNLFVDLSAEEIQPTEDVHGCHMLGCSSGGNCIFEFFIKVAGNESDSDNGDSQIWGYNPEDIHKDKNGRPFYVTISEKRFVKAGTFKHLEHSSCMCHCPVW